MVPRYPHHESGDTPACEFVCWDQPAVSSCLSRSVFGRQGDRYQSISLGRTRSRVRDGVVSVGVTWKCEISGHKRARFSNFAGASFVFSFLSYSPTVPSQHLAFSSIPSKEIRISSEWRSKEQTLAYELNEITKEGQRPNGSSCPEANQRSAGRPEVCSLFGVANPRRDSRSSARLMSVAGRLRPKAALTSVRVMPSGFCRSSGSSSSANVSPSASPKMNRAEVSQ